jgi:excisionase family DNA binding protein
LLTFRSRGEAGREVAENRKPEFLTTRELAELLRIKERKVYGLASSGEIPCSRAMGKLLFPRRAVDQWLARHATGLGPPPPAARPNVFLGSHDPLLDWALRQSRAGLASFFDSSADGLARFARAEGVATGLHIPEAHDAGAETWNVETVRARFADEPVALVEWAWRGRGLIVAPGSAISSLADLKGRRVVARQAEAGSQRLFDRLLAKAGLALDMTAPARSEADAALAVQEGKADAAFGLRALARQYRLGFVSIAYERFDLLVDRRAWFEPEMQRLLAFCRTDAFSAKAKELGGYDLSGFGAVHFNGG